MEGSTITSKSALRTALPQILAITVKNILLLGYGMTMGFPTILIPRLTNLSEEDDLYLTPGDISWTGSISMLCVPGGSMLSGIITAPIGRKKSMQIISTPFVISAVIFRYSEEKWQIYTALAITGLAAGFVEAPVITYVAEITQPNLRGMLSATGSLAVLLGILTEFVLGTFCDWRTVALLGGIPPTAAFCLLYFVPESPLWLIMHDRHEDAKKSLAWLRGWVSPREVEEEFQELSELENKRKMNNETNKGHYFANYLKKSFLNPLALVSFMFFLSHFTGMTTLQTYSVHIFETLRSPIDGYYATILIGVAQFSGTLCCVIFIHFIGKRVLVFLSLGISASCLIIVATYAYSIGVRYFFAKDVTEDNSFSNYRWIPVSGLVFAAFTLQGGIRVLPWILIGEVYPEEIRSIGSGISGAIAYILGFAANKLFLHIVATLTLPGTYWLYSCFSITGLVTLYFWLPETEGKSLHSIGVHFEGGTRLGNKIKRNQHSQQTESNL